MKPFKKFIITLLIISIIASMLVVFVSATGNLAFGAATVNTQSLRLRSGPGLTHSVNMLLSEGDVVVVLNRTNSDWYRVNFLGNVGYVSAPLLRDVLAVENFNAQGRITGSRVNIRSGSATSYSVLTTIAESTVVTVTGINNGWYRVSHNSFTGYIRSDLVEIIPGQRAASAASRPAVPAPVYPVPPANLIIGLELTEFALGFLGYEYTFGGASPSTGFDCSGFVTYVFRNFGMPVTRNASGQFRDNGVHIHRNDLAPGDLVFFSSNGLGTVTHVGIYIGESEFVHSSRSGVGVVISRLDSAYYRSVWHGAKRLIEY